MSPNFANVVEEIKKLPREDEDKEKLKFSLEKYLIEERRKEIYRNYSKGLEELRENKVVFVAIERHNEVY